MTPSSRKGAHNAVVVLLGVSLDGGRLARKPVAGKLRIARNTQITMLVAREVKFLQYGKSALCENCPQLNETACPRAAE